MKGKITFLFFEYIIFRLEITIGQFTWIPLVLTLQWKPQAPVALPLDTFGTHTTLNWQIHETLVYYSIKIDPSITKIHILSGGFVQAGVWQRLAPALLRRRRLGEIGQHWPWRPETSLHGLQLPTGRSSYGNGQVNCDPGQGVRWHQICLCQHWAWLWHREIRKHQETSEIRGVRTHCSLYLFFNNCFLINKYYFFF